MTWLCGIVGSVLSAMLVAWITAHFGWDPLALWVNLILPLGAGLCGMAGSAGLIVGAGIDDRDPDPALRNLFLAMGACAYPVLLFLQYRAIGFGGVPLSSLLGFGDYLAIKLNHASMAIGNGAHPMRWEVGRAGLLLQLGAFAGFVLGYGGGFGLHRFRWLKARGLVEQAV